MDCLRLVSHVWLGNDRLHYLAEDVLRILVDVAHRKNLVVGRNADRIYESLFEVAVLARLLWLEVLELKLLFRLA